MRFLLDTNFLLIPGRFRIDVFSELENFGKPELFTIDLVVSELRKLSAGRGRDSANARLGLELLEKKGVQVLSTSGTNTDHEIGKIASEQDMAVCTQDRELQKMLKEDDVTVIFLRQKRTLSRL